MPFKLSKTTPASFPSSRSVLFNGSNQYLSIANNAAFNFGTGSFTVECWFYATANVSSQQCLITNYSGPSAGWAIQIMSGVINANLYGDGFAISGGSPTINTWYHVALSGAQGSIKLFLNGVQVGSTYTGAVSMNTSAATTIGAIIGVAKIAGYISNVRVVKGTALYTSNFTPSTSPLTAIANTSLLTCNAPTIVDSSNNNFTIINNGSATVSSVVPFNVVSYGYKFNNRNNTAINKFNFKQAARAAVSGTQKAIFGYGSTGATFYSITNLVSNTGVVATDTTGVGTSRSETAASGYGTDKAIFGYGYSPTYVSITNLVSNTGVVVTDTAGVGTARTGLAAAGYGIDKAIFGYGTTGTFTAITNKVSNTGVVATDTTGVGTARGYLAAAGYGIDKAIFGYGYTTVNVSMTNLVSNTGVVAIDTTGVGTARYALAAAGYGSDKAIFGYGYDGSINLSMTNLVGNTGIIATNTTGVGTARRYPAAAGYGSDKSIFGYGYANAATSLTNLVSNTGVVATDTTGVGTVRNGLAAAGYSLT
jgi:hypothetical protein